MSEKMKATPPLKPTALMNFKKTDSELDELFSLFIWNQGAGHFASEIGPSQLFAAYQLIKTLESEGKSRELVAKQLVANFGEKNKNVATEGTSA